jgi:hypothetical protein
MSAGSNSLVGSLLMGSLVAFVYGGVCLYRVRQDAALAKTEATATAQLRLHSQSGKNQGFDSLRCDYSFRVDDNPYQGYGMCPPQPIDRSVKGALLDLAGLLPNPSATVYYDPANPDTNSLTEFGARRGADSLKANVSFGLGVALLILVLVGVLYAGSISRPNEGIAVDTEGTVIYPDQIDSTTQ